MEKKSNKLSYWFLSRPKRTGFIFFLVLIIVISLIVFQRYQLFKEHKRNEISNILNGVEQNIEQSLKNSYTVALTLALTVNNKGIPENFESVADKLVKSNPDLIAVQLVPNGIIKYVYPLKGNEQVLNLDLFKSKPQTILEVKKAINTHKMYFQGPVKLTQGGVGIVGRLPLYINNKFWGFSAVVMRLDVLFKSAGIDNLKYKDHRFQFSKINEVTKKEEFFLPNPPNHIFELSKSIVFPDGDWKLSVINTNPYDTWFELAAALIFGLGLASLSSYLLTRLLKKQAELQARYLDQSSQLSDTESKYKKIFDHAAIGIARVNSISGQILEVNEYLIKFLGYDEQEILSKKIKSVIHPDDVAEDSFYFKKMLAGEIRQFDKEIRYINKEGEILWGNETITPLWAEGEEPTNHIVILEDVTKRKAEERILIESQQRIETLINTIDGIVWEGDQQQTTCTFISNKVEDILGYKPIQCTSTKNFWVKHVHPDDQQWVIAYSSLAIKERRAHDFEYRMIAKDGSVVWIRDIVSVILDADQTVKLRGIMIDITSRKQAENALNKSFNLVTEQNKRLINFSYIVSHNLRSHASNIQGISALIESAQNDEDRNEMIQLLKTVAANLNETLFNLNNIVSIQTSIDIIVEPLNLNAYILKALATQNAQILNREAQILNKVDKNIEIRYNKAYLESILLNLISNALRYSHPDRKPVISITCFDENGQLVLRVSDNGVGIDLAKYGDKIFGIYQTFNGNSDARGFGLFISKNQVEAMGGNISVESTPGMGTTFKIYFKA